MKYLTQIVLNTEMNLDIHDYIKIALLFVGVCAIISHYSLVSSFVRCCLTMDLDIMEGWLFKFIDEKQAEMKKLVGDHNKYLQRRNELLKAFFNEPGKYTVVARRSGHYNEPRIVDITIEPRESVEEGTSN